LVLNLSFYTPEKRAFNLMLEINAYKVKYCLYILMGHTDKNLNKFYE